MADEIRPALFVIVEGPGLYASNTRRLSPADGNGSHGRD